MKWFKHMCNARNDAFIQWLEEEYGFEGVGRWWRIIELIGEAMEKNRADPTATYTSAFWQKQLNMKQVKLNSYFKAIALQGKWNVQERGNLVIITCPNILKMRDEYSRKSGHSPDNVAPEIRDKSKETEKEKKVSSKAQAPSDDKNLMKGKFSALPDWVPKEEWDGYREMRVKIRKPMTAKAEDMAIKKLKMFKDRGLDLKEIINQSTFHDWTGLFEKKDDDFKKPGQPEKKPYHQTLSNYKS